MRMFFRNVRADIQYFADVRRLPAEVLQGVDAIVHLAAISNDPMGKTFEEVTFDVNFRASVDLARQAKAAGVKSFIFASSCSMYGLADDTPRKETSPLNPADGLREVESPHRSRAAKTGGQEFLRHLPTVCDGLRHEPKIAARPRRQ